MIKRTSQSGNPESFKTSWDDAEIDVDRAWRRFLEKVADESAHPAWNRPVAPGVRLVPASAAQAAEATGVHSPMSEPIAASAPAAASTQTSAADLRRAAATAQATPAISVLTAATAQATPAISRQTAASTQTSAANSRRAAATAQATPADLAKSSAQSSWRRKFPYARKIAASAAAICLLAGLYASPWGDRAMAAMLHIFRVQHIVGVDVASQEIEQIGNALMQGVPDAENFDFAQYGAVQAQGGGPGRKVTAAEAEQLAGYPIKLFPGIGQDRQTVAYHPQAEITLRLNIGRVNDLLKRLGGKSGFPAAVDGQPIVLRVPAMVEVQAGGGSGSVEQMLFQLDAPQLEVPDGVDANQVRQAILDLPFLPQDVRQKLQAASDWRNTLYVPVSPGVGRALQIAGHDAVLYYEQAISGQADGMRSGVSESSAGSNASAAAPILMPRSLIWLEGERLYVLSGSSAAFANDDQLIAAAKELVGP